MTTHVCATPIDYERFLAYWFGELDAAEEESVELQLLSCPDCGERAEAWALFDAAGACVRKGQDRIAALPAADRTEVVVAASHARIETNQTPFTSLSRSERRDASMGGAMSHATPVASSDARPQSERGGDPVLERRERVRGQLPEAGHRDCRFLGDAGEDDAGAHQPSRLRAADEVRCDVFVTESTFGLPIYRWAPQTEVLEDMRAWWADCAAQGKHALLMGYSLGKAQRLLAGLATDEAPGPVLVHAAVARLNAAYRAAGVALPEVETVTPETNFKKLRGALVIAPPAVQDSRWAKAMGPHSDAFASGWMQVRGNVRRRNTDAGFALSDHADWNGLITAVKATGAGKVFVTHGFQSAFSRYLNENGIEAAEVKTEYGGEEEEQEKSSTTAEQDKEINSAGDNT